MLYTLNVAMAFAFLASLYGDFMKAVGASVRIFELIDRKPAISLEGGAQPFDFGGDIVFNEVFFTYPSRPDSQVLKVKFICMSSGYKFNFDRGTLFEWFQKHCPLP